MTAKVSGWRPIAWAEIEFQLLKCASLCSASFEVLEHHFALSVDLPDSILLAYLHIVLKYSFRVQRQVKPIRGSVPDCLVCGNQLKIGMNLSAPLPMDVKPSASVTAAVPARGGLPERFRASLPFLREAKAGHRLYHGSPFVMVLSLVKLVNSRRTSCRATRDINGMSDLVERGYDGFLLRGLISIHACFVLSCLCLSLHPWHLRLDQYGALRLYVADAHSQSIVCILPFFVKTLRFSMTEESCSRMSRNAWISFNDETFPWRSYRTRPANLPRPPCA